MDKATTSIFIVGVCASGKTVLANALERRGFNARGLAQEHSNVTGMWRAHGRPDVLIYLDAEPETINARLERQDWNAALVAEQRRRLSDARAHCDLYVRTDELSEAQVLEQVLLFLEDAEGAAGCGERRGAGD